MGMRFAFLVTVLLGTVLAVGCDLGIPEDPGIGTASKPVIYGDDDRVEYYQATAAQRGAADSVFVVVDTSELSCSGGDCTLLTVPYDDWFAEGLCEDEAFRDQPTLGYCSAFLVGEDRIATAGHCVTSSECAHTAFVPRFRVDFEGGSAPTTIPEAEVLHCDSMVVRKYKRNDDYAVFTLTAPAVGLTPLCIRRSGTVAVGTDLVIIGHPYTLPQKIAGGAMVQSNAKNFFNANLDDYGGNSGSPVFDAETMEVQGILVRGNTDYVFDYGGSCWRSNVCPDSGCPGFEEASHAKKIAGFVPSVPCYVPADCGSDADCDDGDLCNGAEVCGAGGCEPGAPLACDDGDPCTDDACDPTTGCYQTVTDCDNGDPCDGVEFCGATGCESGDPVVCQPDSDPCTDEQCDPDSGACVSVDNGECVEDDVVSVTKAKYTRAKAKLEVLATSSAQPDVSLSVHYTASGAPLSYEMTFNAGKKQRYELKRQDVPRPDGDVLTVVSTGGGSASMAVQIK